MEVHVLSNPNPLNGAVFLDASLNFNLGPFGPASLYLSATVDPDTGGFVYNLVPEPEALLLAAWALLALHTAHPRRRASSSRRLPACSIVSDLAGGG